MPLAILAASCVAETVPVDTVGVIVATISISNCFIQTREAVSRNQSTSLLVRLYAIADLEVSLGLAGGVTSEALVYTCSAQLEAVNLWY